MFSLEYLNSIIINQNLIMKKGLKLKKLLFLVIVAFIINLQANSQTVTTDTQSTHDGYFYSFWNAGGGTVEMTLGSGGNYSVIWTNCNNFTCGKGWKPGSPANISYSGSFNGGSNGYLALYGWTLNELIEYYVVENYGSWTPPGGNSIGTLISDGGTYKIYKTLRTNQPSIAGTATFYQYWSVRTTKRSSGTITFSNHINAWANLGMNLGSTWDYKIMETEGYKSSGSSDITVSEGSSYITLAVSSTKVNIGAAANSTGTFLVVSNSTSWTVSSSQTWLTVSPDSGANNATVTVTAQQNTDIARTATVTITPTGADPKTVTITQADGSTEVSSASQNSNFEVYPNPVTDELNVSLPVSQSVVSLHSVNATQLLVLKTKCPEIKIDMKKYNAGIYILKIVTEGQTLTKKIIKQNL
jgi:hypothetical protein